MVRQALALLKVIGLLKKLEIPFRAAKSSPFRFRLSELARVVRKGPSLGGGLGRDLAGAFLEPEPMASVHNLWGVLCDDHRWPKP